MLDESLCGMADAERAAADGLCDLFNLRLSKCGGFIPSLRLAQFAARHGLGYQLGCQVGETAVLSAAGRHFATSVKDLRYRRGVVRPAPGPAPAGRRRTSPSAGAGGPRRSSAPASGIGVQEEWVEWLATAQGGADWLTSRAAGRAGPADVAHGDRLRRVPLALPPVRPAGRAGRARRILARHPEPRRMVPAVVRADRRRRVRGVLPRPPRLRAEHRGPRRRPELPPPARRRRRVRPHTAGRQADASHGGDLLGREARRRAPVPAPGPGGRAGAALPGLLPEVRAGFFRRLRIGRCAFRDPTRKFPIPLNDPALFTASERGGEFLRERPARPARGDGPDAVRRATRSTSTCAGPKRWVTVPTLLLLAEHDRIIDNAEDAAVRRQVPRAEGSDRVPRGAPHAGVRAGRTPVRGRLAEVDGEGGSRAGLGEPPRW